jgi:hypothetical protein
MIAGCLLLVAGSQRWLLVVGRWSLVMLGTHHSLLIIHRLILNTQFSAACQ